MSKKPEPWFRAGRGWYVTVNDQQVSLGVPDPDDKDLAFQALRKLLDQMRGPPPAPPSPTVAEAVAAFLADRAPHVKPHTLKGYRLALAPLLAHSGTTQIDQLDAREVEAQAKRRKWADTTRANYLNTVEQMVRWAGRRDFRLAKPPRASAGADSVIPPELHEKVLCACVGDWRQCVRFMWLTGCRPSEAAGLTVEVVDWSAGVVRLKEHKTAYRGKQRLLYLCPEALEVLKAQRAKHGTGHLFRGKAGRPFSRQAFVMKFRRLSEKVGRRVVAYGYRHSFATRALAAGEQDSVVAALLGHAGTQMLHRHYSHLTSQARLLKASVSRLNQPPPAA